MLPHNQCRIIKMEQKIKCYCGQYIYARALQRHYTGLKHKRYIMNSWCSTIRVTPEYKKMLEEGEVAGSRVAGTF